MKIIFESDEEAQEFYNFQVIPLTKALGALENTGSPLAKSVDLLHNNLQQHYWHYVSEKLAAKASAPSPAPAPTPTSSTLPLLPQEPLTPKGRRRQHGS